VAPGATCPGAPAIWRARLVVRDGNFQLFAFEGATQPITGDVTPEGIVRNQLGRLGRIQDNRFTGRAA
jgi:hypothetical protein